MVRAGGIAERGADAAIALGDEILVRVGLALAVGPVAPCPCVEALGEGFGQAIRERLHHDRLVVVVVLLEAGGEIVRFW